MVDYTQFPLILRLTAGNDRRPHTQMHSYDESEGIAQRLPLTRELSSAARLRERHAGRPYRHPFDPM